MKIIQTSKAYYPHLGGIETVVQQLAEGFALQHGYDSQVVVCNDERCSAHNVYNHVTIDRSATLARVASLPISPGYVLNLMRQTGDILHIHEPFLIGAMTYLCFLRQARRRFKRLVIWWHSDIIRQRTLAYIYTPLLHAILDQADAIIAATPSHISSSTFLPKYESKCHVIHYGVDMNRFTETPALSQRIADIKAAYNKPIVLFAGRLVYYKGVEYLVEAMRTVPDAHLVVVGSGPLQQQLETIAATCPENVTFIPFLPEHDLVAMYHACDIFALPSVENSEGFGIVQLEAMACGKPVITADLLTGVTYVNQDGRTGLVVPKRNPEALARALNLLLNNPDLRQYMGNYARARVLREFTVTQMVDRTVRLYQELLHSGS